MLIVCVLKTYVFLICESVVCLIFWSRLIHQKNNNFLYLYSCLLQICYNYALDAADHSVHFANIICRH